MRFILAFVCLTLASLYSYGQADSSLDLDKKDIRYQPVTEDYFKGHEKAKLIVDYYYTWGISYGDRYSYEIIIVDSVVMLGFSSPESDSFKYLSYAKKHLLNPAQVDSLTAVIRDAKLKQLVKGVPEPNASAHTKEVLIVRYRNVNIAGGLFNHEVFPDAMAADLVNKEIAAQRRLTSSIGGDYNKVIAFLRKYFPDLDNLIMEAQQEE